MSEGSSAMWPGTAEELIALQHRLATAADVVEMWRPPARPLLVAAAFCAFPTGRPGPGAAGDPACAAAVLWREATGSDGVAGPAAQESEPQPAGSEKAAEREGRRPQAGAVVARSIVRGEAGAAYEAGLLALRAGRLLAAALEKLWQAVDQEPAGSDQANPRPDAVLLDATGRDHPRRAGLALHVGAALDLPSIGVTNRILMATAETPDERVGSIAPLLLDNEVVGYALRSRRDVHPILVHAGWRTSPPTALEIARRLVVRWRTPEPLRLARHDARVARAEAEGRIG